MASRPDAKRKKRGLGLGGAAARAAEAGRRSAETDLKVEEDNLRREKSARLLPIAQILPRPSADTRPVNPDHVEALIESIKLIGLIQPVYLDRGFHLVAGAHRLEAFRRLAEEDPQRWSKIPVVVDPDLDAIADPERALIKEIAENEKRSNLTPEQVQQAAARLIASDSTFTRRPGRLKKGERALTPFLASTFGVSTRYVRSLLNHDSGEQEHGQGTTKRGSQREDSQSDTPAQRAKKVTRLKAKITRQLKKWADDPLLDEDEKVREALLNAWEQLS